MATNLSSRGHESFLLEYTDKVHHEPGLELSLGHRVAKKAKLDPAVLEPTLHPGREAFLE